MEKDFPKGFSVCFHCNQTSHQKAECPYLTHGSTQASAPATLHVTDSRSGKAEPPRARGRAVQLTAEEVRAAPDVIAGTYLHIYVILRFVYAYIVLYIGTFLVSFVPALVLFDSGAS